MQLLDSSGTVLKKSSISDATDMELPGIAQLKADLNAGTYYISVSAGEGIMITDPYEYIIISTIS